MFFYRGEQVQIMCMMEDLMPSVGTSIPSPSILAVIISQWDSVLQTVARLYSDEPQALSDDVQFDSPFNFCDGSILTSKKHFISISDDGKIWSWVLTDDGSKDTQKESRESVEPSSSVNGYRTLRCPELSFKV